MITKLQLRVARLCAEPYTRVTADMLVKNGIVRTLGGATRVLNSLRANQHRRGLPIIGKTEDGQYTITAFGLGVLWSCRHEADSGGYRPNGPNGYY